MGAAPTAGSLSLAERIMARVTGLDIAAPPLLRGRGALTSVPRVVFAPKPSQKTFLFLQGPASPFMDRVARGLIAQGHRALRINLHFGDAVFWRLPATNFRGRFSDWPVFIARYLVENGVTDIVLLGDQRPYHQVAADAARARGIRVTCTELGYLRPDWLTLERDGMSSASRFPKNPDLIRAISERFDAPDLTPRYTTPFWRLACWDLAYNFGEVLAKPFFPHYRRHAIHHPLAEYTGWLRRLAGKPFTRRRMKRRVNATLPHGPFFLFPLQLSTDYQIRAHSPFPDMETALDTVLASFAAHAPPTARLVVKVHPLDNGLAGWERRVEERAGALGIADRIIYLDWWNLARLLRRAAGVVTINSTVGTTALMAGKPLIALGSAIYDVPGLTFQGPLDRYWSEAAPPDVALRDAFVRALAGATQLKGGYYAEDALDAAVTGAVERLDRGVFDFTAAAGAKTELALAT